MYLFDWSDHAKMRRLRLGLYGSLSILACIYSFSYSYSYGDTSNTSLFDGYAVFDETSISGSDLDRVLQFEDDDRHNGGPNDQDATNGPTVIGYTRIPSSRPSREPSPLPTVMPTLLPSTSPTAEPSGKPSFIPSAFPSVGPSARPSSLPSSPPTVSPSMLPSNGPSASPSSVPSKLPTLFPTSNPSAWPSVLPTTNPSSVPTLLPSLIPSLLPTSQPADSPSLSPSFEPSTVPSGKPSFSPSNEPSRSPSSEPSLQPSREPSLSPSLQPSGLPSSIPSSSPSLDPCKGYNGTFGNTTSTEFTISFLYGVESDKNMMESMPASLSEQVKEIEQLLLDLLIESFFDHCSLATSSSSRSRKLNVFEKGFGQGKSVKHFVPITTRTDPSLGGALSDIVGIKANPLDIANGKKCVGDYANSLDINADCNAIDGKLTVYLSDMEDATNVTNSILEKINYIIDAKLLNECHQAILQVMSIISPPPRLGRDDDYYVIEKITPIGNSTMWMFAASGVIAVLAISVGTRFRYASQFKNDGSGELKDNYEYEEENSEEFVEYTGESTTASFISPLPEI